MAANGTAATTSSNMAKVVINLIVPSKIAAQVIARSNSTRAAQYVSPSTLSLTVGITPSTGGARIQYSFPCSVTSCIASFLAPVGNDTFALSLSDASSGGGNALALSNATPATIAPNITNVVDLTANPVVRSVAVLLGAVPAATASTNGGTPADVPVTVKAMDADGNTIIGPGNYVDINGNPITLSLAVMNVQAGGSGRIELSQTSFSSPPTGAINAHYDGNWLAQSVISVTSSSSLPIVTSSATLTSIGTSIELSAGFTPSAGLLDLRSGSDGNLWFIETSGRVGRISPSGSVAEFSAGISPGFIRGLTAGPDGNIWFTEFGANKIGRITPTGAVTEFASGLSPGAAPFGIVTGADGNLWFTENGANRIGRITPTGIVTEYSTGLSSGANLAYIAAGPDGNLWFTEFGRGQIGRITLSGTITEFSGGLSANAALFDIEAGADGNLWATEGNAGIARITPSGAITEFSSGISPKAYPYFICRGPDGNMWFTESDSHDSIARITPSGVVTEFSHPVPTGRNLNGIALGPDGNLWYTEYLGNQISKFVL